MEQYYVYTDGSCQGNPGPGGWAAIIKSSDGTTYRELTGAELKTTNNRMELIPVIEALGCIDKGAFVIVVSDSQYVTNAFNRHWLKNWKTHNWRKANGDKVCNIDLWKQLDELVKQRDVTFIWVKGHAGHAENELCDKLAKKAITKLCKFSK